MFKNSSIFVLVNDNNGISVKLLEVDAETKNEICSTFVVAVKQLTSGKEIIEFDGNYKPENDELLKIENFNINHMIFDAIRSPLGVQTIAYSKNNEPDIRAVFVGERNEYDGSETFTIAFQRFRKDQYLKTGKVRLFFDENTFVVEKRWGIIIGDYADCLYTSGQLQFSSYYFARQIFDLSAYYRSATDSEVTSFSSNEMLKIDDSTKFYNMADTWIRKKIASINDSRVLENYSLQAIKERADKVKLNIDIDDDKIIIPSDKPQLKKILGFLDDEVYKGTFSEEIFMANSKRKV